MNIKRLSHEDQDAIRLAMEYWHACWDWESPTLLGIDFVEFDHVVSDWPNVRKGDEDVATLAAIGSLRELLLGASAQPNSAIQSVIGIPYDRAASLLEQLSQT
jgi:hypothetical protein